MFLWIVRIPEGAVLQGFVYAHQLSRRIVRNDYFRTIIGSFAKINQCVSSSIAMNKNAITQELSLIFFISPQKQLMTI